MRFFNTEGPVVAQDHYCVPSLTRMDLDYVLNLIRHKKYFFVHGSRRIGKTSALKALQDRLNSRAEGNYRCLYVNIALVEAVRKDVVRAISAVLQVLARRALNVLGDCAPADIRRKVLAEANPDTALRNFLQRWAQADRRPLVVLIDEIDALAGEALRSVLRQLRSGYDERPESFPHSVVLCGVRGLRDYRTRSGSEGNTITGGGVLNIWAESLRLRDFDRAAVAALLGQHTSETGQQFEPSALERVYAQTAGQPWLVNALCAQACFRNSQGRNRSRPITEDDIVGAQEVLIEGRVGHLGQLANKLEQEGVQRVIEPMLSGATRRSSNARDLEYVRELGLVAMDAPPRIANPIYADMVPWELTYATREDLLVEPTRYIDEDGALDLAKLLEAFQEYFRENSEHRLNLFQYREAGPQLLLQAFLHRVLNGGGRIAREYGLGRRRVDLFILWPRPGAVQRFVIECKILRGGLDETLKKGLPQTADYMDRCAADSGHLVVFDRSEKPWAEKVYRRTEEFDGTPIEVWGI